MNLLAIYDEPKHRPELGAVVSSTVSLLWDEEEPFAKKPFRAQTSVNGSRMCTSHHATAGEAKRHAEKMHGAYLEAHSS